MFTARNIHLILTLCLCGLVLSGCRSSGRKRRDLRNGSGDTADFVIPDEIEGDYALDAARPGEGSRVSSVVFDSVAFQYDSFQIADSEIGKIERVAAYMRENPSQLLVVEGHCDERGSREYNLSLGEHRALSVRAYLIGLGIDSSRIQTRSYGEENPLDLGHGDGAWRANRRGEFAVYE